MKAHRSVKTLDDVDRTILQELQTNCSLSNAELARRVNLSPPATSARIKRLEEDGFVRGYVAILDRDKIGYSFLCLISVSLQSQMDETVKEFVSAIHAIPEILECLQVTGEHDYVLKVALPTHEDLDPFLRTKLGHAPGVARYQTSIILSETKSMAGLPIL